MSNALPRTTMSSPQASLFNLSDPVSERLLREMNPWWRGIGVPNLQPVRRWAYDSLLRGLRSQLAPVIVLRGPRQVGKSTLQAQVIDELLRAGVDPRFILRVQFDDVKALHKRQQPILEIVWWYADHILGAPLSSVGEGPVYLFLDEAQNLRDWAPQIKHLVDLQPVRAMITGSSALRIEAGRDSLAGRIQTLELGPLLLREIIELRRLGRILPFSMICAWAVVASSETSTCSKRYFGWPAVTSANLRSRRSTSRKSGTHWTPTSVGSAFCIT